MQPRPQVPTWSYSPRSPSSPLGFVPIPAVTKFAKPKSVGVSQENSIVLYLVALWLSASFSPALCLSFLLYKMELMVPASGLS